MRSDKKNNKKTIIFAGAAALLCLIAAGIMVLMLNSDERKLNRRLQLGQKYLEEMNYEQAAAAFDEAIKIDPANVDAYLGLADAYIGLEDLDAAVKVLEEGYKQTESNEILQKLEELQGMSEESKMEEPVEDKEENEAGQGVPYYEFVFSPEDFTVAGYSVMDGGHIDDVLQAAAEIMPHYDDVKFDFEYDGWRYYTAELSSVRLNYHTPRFNFDVVSYTPHVDGFMIFVSVPLDFLPANEIPFNEIPLYEGLIVPGVTSYEESLDILGIRQLIQALEATESDENSVKSLEFESQYGAARCSTYEEVQGNKNISIQSGKDWCLDFEVEDNVLSMIRVRNSDLY